MSLMVGDLIPKFKSFFDNNEIITDDFFLNKISVLYFYPKDNTSGCTKEACDFMDNFERISEMGVTIIGVSPDNIKSHLNFKQKFNLNFMLIADPEKEICNKFGVIGEKSLYGKKYLGVIRSTFLLGPDKKIIYKWENVKVNGHVEEIIKKIEKLKNYD